MLKLKRIPIESFEENIVYLHRNCSSFRAYDIKNLSKVEIHGGVNPLYASLYITDDENIVKQDELGANMSAFRRLSLPEGASVSIAPSPSPPSIDSIRRKIAGNILSAGEYKSIINDIVSHRYSNLEVASFLVSTGSFMTAQEVLSLAEAIAGDENHIHWDSEEMVVDYHCLGGVPGNKVDLIVTPIVAAYGMAIPKTGGRSVSSCSGVVDTMDVLANTNVSEHLMKKIISENRGCIISDTGLAIAPANKVIASIERTIGVSQQQQFLATILAMKLCAGVTHFVFDIPVGPKSKIRSMPEAMRLRKIVEYVGDMLSMEIDVVVTDGSEPIGNGVGSVLEARDVMKVLRCKEDAPKDLREKALFIAGRILEFDPNLRGGQGYYIAQEILDSGRALEIMNRIIFAQGKTPPPKIGQLTRDVAAHKAGVVESIDSERIERVAILAGATQDKGSGVDLLKKVGDNVEQGEIIYRIHASNPTDFAFANGAVEGYSGYEIK